MQLVKLIIHKRIKTLYCYFSILGFFFLIISAPVNAQDNSPYSRYGIGDLVPPTHIINRGMGGISAGYTDRFSLNFNNPASYSSFESLKESKSKKLTSGRAILDVGINLESRTLSAPSAANKFTATNSLFSYVQVGMPLRKSWGLSFGLRPVSRISYNIIKDEMLKDPRTGLDIDSAVTNYTGTGGTYMVNVGTGFSIFEKVREDFRIHKLSVGINGTYLFGSKDYSSRRSLLNDTVAYYQANYETKTNFGSIFFDAGMQYMVPVGKKLIFTLGAYGNWGQNINARQDILRETYQYDVNVGNVRLDSVSDQRDVKGKIMIPAAYTIGFVIQKPTIINKQGAFIFGVDFTKQNWEKYRFYGQKDSVQNSWLLKVGAELNPVPKRTYFSNVIYRFGFYTGPDYIKLSRKLPQIGGSFGLGLPIAYSRQAPNQVTRVNLAFEYGRRGNDQNLLKESLFRISIGFSLSDFWFIKRKYD